MNACYTMRRTDSPLFFLTLFIIAFEAFSLPATVVTRVDTNDEQPNTVLTEAPTSEPLSRIVFVNELSAGKTVTYRFAHGAKVYVANSKDADADVYEEKIQITVHDADGASLRSNSLLEAGSKVERDTGKKQPVSEASHSKFSIANTNTETKHFKNPAIIYFVLETDDSHVSTVYESDSQYRNIYVKDDNIGRQYVTLLNPTGAVKISQIRHIDGLTALSVSAGGIEETNDMNYTIHNIGKDDALSKAPLVIVEPVVTFQKQLSIFPSEFEFTTAAVDVPTGQVVVPMNWSDWSVAMSPAFMLSNESSSFKYVFNASLENSQFDVQMFGEIDESSSVSLSYDGYDGVGTEILSKRHLERLAKNTKGQTLTVEYKRGEQDKTKGVLVRVKCSQPASIPLLYTVFSAVALRYLFL